MFCLLKKLPIFFLLFLLLLSVPTQAEENLFARFGTDYDDVLVTEVISANTIRLENREIIRLIGVKAPELPPQERAEFNEFGFRVEHKVDPAGTLEEKALEFVKELLENQQVRVEFDHQKTDEHLDTIAYVFLNDGTFVNAEILRQGYARLTIRPPNLKYADELRAAYQEARREKRGLQGE